MRFPSALRSMMQLKFRRAIPSLGLLATLIAIWLAYRPGLAGGFLFDDFINLDAIGRNGAISDWPAFWRYLTSGTADPFGRPISLLSFLLDARDWPADPGPFLRTNLLIHLLNGSLLFLLLRRLDSILRPNSGVSVATALLGAALWSLHPLFVSTTLYVVQREAMLPATFVLLGLLAYARGRVRFSETGGASGMTLMTAGVLAGTILATLSKANGLLLPLLALVLEATVFSIPNEAALDGQARARLRKFTLALLVFPSVVIGGYVLHFLADWNVMQGERGWSIGQRVLTEPRILYTYLLLLFVPRSISTGLFNDAYPAAQGLLQPLSTLPCAIAIGALIGFAIIRRKRVPAMSAAVLFFFAGHLLESTAVPLELYFEHRNYLPALLLFWPLSHFLCSWNAAVWKRSAVAATIVVMLASTTYQRAVLWGNPEALNSVWLRTNPTSSRAQSAAAIALVDSGHPDLAVGLLRPLWEMRPHDLQLAVNLATAACLSGGLTEMDTQALSRTFRNLETDNDLLYRWLGKAIGLADLNGCPGMTLRDVESWTMAADANPVVAHFREQPLDLESLAGKIAIARRNPNVALAHFERKLLRVPRPGIALQQAAWLASAGYHGEARSHLQSYERIADRVPRAKAGMPWVHAWILERQGYWEAEIAWMKGQLQEFQSHEPITPATVNEPDE